MQLTPIVYASVFFVMGLTSAVAKPAQIQVSDSNGKAIVSAMVSVARTMPKSPAPQADPSGYPIPQVPYELQPEVTQFTDPSGKTSFDVEPGDVMRVRAPGYQDAFLETIPTVAKVKLVALTTPAEIAAQRPANAWLGSIRWERAEDYPHFKMQCGFCHQQGNLLTRAPRDAETWKTHISRMIRYGSRLPTRLQKSLPNHLVAELTRLQDHPEQVQESTAWSQDLNRARVVEWKIGDGFSQTHDMLFSSEGALYVGDNIQDRIYQIRPKQPGQWRDVIVKVFVVPHLEGEKNGGLIAGRLRDFPKHDSTSNVHSLAESKVDGHIFLTPSAQRRIIELDPKTGEFKIHQMSEGLYPHTIRIDAKDRVWFTLALSNQVGMLDRSTGKFRFYSLPARSTREKLTLAVLPQLFKLMSWGLPISNWVPVDEISTGVPLPYGIDITPDQKVWFTRLYSQEIGVIDPEVQDSNAAVTMIGTPFVGPRRLRTDARGNLWITSYGESKIAEYQPSTGKFRQFDLPVKPVNSDTPYSLAVDLKRDRVWVNGNQSDSIFGFNIKTEKWIQIPLPKRTSFTRDFDFDEQGNVFTANSNFPSWHIEGGQPTTMRIEVGEF